MAKQTSSRSSPTSAKRKPASAPPAALATPAPEPAPTDDIAQELETARAAPGAPTHEEIAARASRCISRAVRKTGTSSVTG